MDEYAWLPEGSVAPFTVVDHFEVPFVLDDGGEESALAPFSGVKNGSSNAPAGDQEAAGPSIS